MSGRKLHNNRNRVYYHSSLWLSSMWQFMNSHGATDQCYRLHSLLLLSVSYLFVWLVAFFLLAFWSIGNESVSSTVDNSNIPCELNLDNQLQSTFTTVIFIQHQTDTIFVIVRCEVIKKIFYGTFWEREKERPIRPTERYNKKMRRRKKNHRSKYNKWQRLFLHRCEALKSVIGWTLSMRKREASWCCEVTMWRQLQMSINVRMQSGRRTGNQIQLHNSAETLKRVMHTEIIQVKHRSVCCFHHNNSMQTPMFIWTTSLNILKDGNVGQRQIFQRIFLPTQTD